MTYRAKQAARMRRREPRWLRRERLLAKYGGNQFHAMHAILRDRYRDPGIPAILYSRFLWVLEGPDREDYVTSVLKHVGIPAESLTARADFAAAAYWYARKLGPKPEAYVARRHAREPYR